MNYDPQWLLLVSIIHIFRWLHHQSASRLFDGSLAQPDLAPAEARKDQVGEDNSRVPRGPMHRYAVVCSHTLLIGHGDRVYFDLLSDNY